LLLATLQRKARFYPPAEAIAIEDNRLGARTRDGPSITGRHLVLTTGYELLDIVPSVSHRIISTWAIATRPQPRKLWPLAAHDLGGFRPLSLCPDDIRWPGDLRR